LKGGVELGRVDEDEARQHAIDGASDRMADTFMAGLLGPLAAKVKVKGSETLKWAGRVAASENRLAQGLAKRFAYNWKGFWGRGGEELVSKMKAVLHLESDNTGVQNIFIQSTGRRLSDFSSESLNQFLRSLSGKKLIGLSRALNAVRVYGIDVIKGLGVRIDAKALAKADAEMVLELFKRLKGIDIAGLSEKALQDTLSGLSGKLNGTMEKLWFSIRAARKYGLKAIEENGHVKSPFFDEFKEYRRAVYREVESRMSPWRSKLFSAKGAANKSQKWAALKHVFRREASNDVISAYKTLQTASAPANGADKVLLDRIFGVINKPLDWFESQVRGFFRIPLENSRYMGQTFVPETKEAVKIALRVKETSRFAWLRVKGFVQDEVEGAVKGAISGVRNVPEVKNPGKLRQAVKKIGLWCANLFGKISKPLNKHILTKEVERALGRWPLIPAVIDYAFYDPDDGFKSWDGKFDTAWGFWSFVFSSCYMSSVSMGNTTFGAVNAAFVKALTFITWMYKSDMDDSSEIDYKSLTGSHLEYLFLAPFNAMLSSGIHFLKGFAVGRTLASVPYARLLPSMTAFPWAFMPGSLFVKPVFERAGRLLTAGYYSLIVGWGTGFVFGSKKLIDADPYYKFQRTIKNLLVGLHFQPLQYALGYLSGLGQFVVRWWGYAWEATILYYPTPIYLDKGRNIPKVTRLLAENSPEGREEIWKSFVEQNVSLDLLGVYDRIVMFGEDLTPTGFEWHAPRSLEWRFETRAIMKQWLPRLDGRMTEDEAAGGKVIRWGDDHIKALTETYRQQMNNNEAEWEDSLKYQKGMVVFGMIVKMYADKARKGEERFKPFLNLVREQPYKDYWKSIPTPVNASDLERKIKEVDEKEIDPGKIAKLLYDTNVLKKSGDF
ncbi:MAG: hypothetical protein HYU98_06420, partial [Deltaproteobacteria bacterium]|nr:hypothetical protein [Deltaproteobacteria bacterium]